MSYKPSNPNGQATAANSEPVVLASDVDVEVVGNVAHDAVDSGNPVKIGGKASTSTPTAVANGDRVDAFIDQWGRQVVTQYDVEFGTTPGRTSLRDQLTAERYTELSDSVADGFAAFWTTTTASGGTATVSVGEGLIQSSAGASGSAQITSTSPAYFPGQESWFNSAIRVGDTGASGNVRRWGVFTVSGTTPQDGFAYELSGTTFNATVFKGGVASATAVASWSRVADAPFTLDTNYHSFEIRWTANAVRFYVDNILRHVVAGTTTAITATLNFPMTIQTVNSSGSANHIIAVRNCGIGRFGFPSSLSPAGPLSIAKAEDVPHVTGDVGVPVWAVRTDTATARAGTDGDYAPLEVDANGRLHVVLSAATNQPVNVAQINGTTPSMGSGVVGTGVQRVVLATDVALPAGTNNIGDVDVLTLPNVTLAAGTNTNEVVGDVAEDAALAGNPVRQGVRASNARPTAMSADGDVVTPAADLSGQAYVIPGRVATATLANVASSATSVTLQASNTSRKGLIIYNDSTQVLYLKYGATASTSSFTYYLAAGATWEMPSPLYTGVVDGIWASANGNARVTELTA